ncbi:SacI homology domain-containing protein [Rhodofomes roseus]|uniref:SacI homology domain-containing protein n=1 Tax=Rhodofomes roseus TaxID=34475 RepID=A0ABQ8KXC8_9APHY|nr:SacI homology domain-containing protein [Rhodofomes roseus]KAH9843189.1 SacI homology domain-containing protein [Rhodofomes roseus]
MKRLLSFNRAGSSKNPVPASPVNPASTAPGGSHTTGLQPKYVLPPLPHPCPHEHIAIIATDRGLLLRPHFLSETHVESYVCIPWGKNATVEELPHGEEFDHIDWSESVVVYGIVGILSLFTASYLLIVTARAEVGHLFDPRHTVYSVKGITSIPLTEDLARPILSSLAARNSTDARVSLAPPTSRPETPSVDAELLSASQRTPAETLFSAKSVMSPNNAGTPPPRVTFAAEPNIKIMTPHTSHGFDEHEQGKVEGAPPSPSASVTSVASSAPSTFSVNTESVAKTLAARLSFWNRLPKRSSAAPTASEQQDADEDPETGTNADEDHARLSLDKMMKENNDEPAQVVESILQTTAPAPATQEEKRSELEDKILREVIREYTKGGMYFAYAFDITRSLQHKHEMIAKAKTQSALLEELNALDENKRLSSVGEKIEVLAEPSPTLPLWRRVDRQFWWNEWLSRPFIDAGVHPYVLPIMQGYYQIASFHVPREPVASEEGDAALVDYAVVSRRSRDRAGLRYQRRGIDDDANVANFVETETIMRVEREGFSNVFSHVQIRGSIPLYWKQEGYSLKPAPQLAPDRTHDQNLDAIRRHFKKTLPVYGPHTIVNLAEQHGKEAQVTDAYRDYVKELDDKQIQYHAYDFHTETKGMKYENISKLITQLERVFENQGYFWISNNTIMSRQHGIYRVNCIDCLDRTNVVESAFARHVLDRQLGAVALLDPSEDKATRTETDIVFNDAWANNGDAISREYAGTSALKGDYTRTGKRDLTGMLNDGVNSLARMYASTFADWFSQAVIDFMLGNRTISVFSEFLNRLQSSDPRDLIRISKIRADAIATCVSRVLPEGERLLSGWTVFSPTELNTKVGDKFEEKVLLLTMKALYIISYDYTLEKVKMYTRVPLKDIEDITKGAYILSPLEEASRDPEQNSGFVVTWRNVGQDTRVTSYSIRNSLDLSSPLVPDLPPLSPRLSRRASAPAPQRKPTLSALLSKAAVPVAEGDSSFVAFKMLPIDPTRTRRDTGSFIEPADELAGATNCKQAADMIVSTIRQACVEAGGAQGDNFIAEEDIVSLADAQRMTSVYAKMEYGVKRLLWLGGS